MLYLCGGRPLFLEREYSIPLPVVTTVVALQINEFQRLLA